MSIPSCLIGKNDAHLPWLVVGTDAWNQTKNRLSPPRHRVAKADQKFKYSRLEQREIVEQLRCEATVVIFSIIVVRIVTWTAILGVV